MSDIFILDACALIALLAGESGAECIINKGILVISDHNDFEKIEKKENLKINWFR